MGSGEALGLNIDLRSSVYVKRLRDSLDVLRRDNYTPP
jgi:hypothetical protein